MYSFDLIGVISSWDLAQETSCQGTLMFSPSWSLSRQLQMLSYELRSSEQRLHKFTQQPPPSNFFSAFDIRSSRADLRVWCASAWAQHNETTCVNHLSVKVAAEFRVAHIWLHVSLSNSSRIPGHVASGLGLVTSPFQGVIVLPQRFRHVLDVPGPFRLPSMPSLSLIIQASLHPATSTP